MRHVPILLLFLVGWLAAAGGCGDGPAPVGFEPQAGDGLDFNRVYLFGTDIGGSREAPTMTLRIYAQQIDGLYAGGFRVTYDPAMLDLVDVVSGDNLRSFGTSFEHDGFQPGEVMVGFVLDEPRADAEIGSLVFAAPVEGSSTVEFAEPPAGLDLGSRMLTDRRGYQRHGVRWIGGTMTRYHGGSR